MAEDGFSTRGRDVLVRSLLHSGGIIVGAYLAAFALIALGYNLLAAVTGLTPENAELTYRVFGTVLQFLGFIAAAVWYFRRIDDDGILAWDWPGLRTVGWVVGGFVLLFLASASMTLVLSLFGAAPAQNQVITTGKENPVYFLYMIPIAFLLVGPGEELLFRGVVQGRLRQAFGMWPGILLASAVFGLAHWLALIGSGQGKLVYIAVAAMLGLVLGTVYEYSENILVPIAIHGLWNAMLFAVNWYIAVYGVEMPT